MKIGDITALMGHIAPVIREFTEGLVNPIAARMTAVEKTVTDFRVPTDGQKGEDGKDGRDGTDGIGVEDASINRAGELVLRLTSGEAVTLGRVEGKDGAPGNRGDDGKDGRDGTDGLGFDDLDVVHDGARGFTLRFARGDQVKEFPFTLPVVLDKGVYKVGDDYEPGDGVTYGGSFWIAQEKTQEKPDSGQGWRLAVKRGRDGKSAPLAAIGSKEPLRVGVPAKAI